MQQTPGVHTSKCVFIPMCKSACVQAECAYACMRARAQLQHPCTFTGHKVWTRRVEAHIRATRPHCKLAVTMCVASCMLLCCSECNSSRWQQPHNSQRVATSIVTSLKRLKSTRSRWLPQAS
eukprot:1159193-Pelagomonas_calceolata.AAC.3